MATKTLKVIIDDSALPLSTEGFLEVCPMPQIDDPDWVDPEDGTKAPKIDKFSSVDLLKADYLATHFVKVCNKGLIRLAKKTNQKIDSSKVTSEV